MGLRDNEARSSSQPFKKIRNIYGSNMEEMPNLSNKTAPDNIDEILDFNRNKNQRNRLKTIIFNTFMVIAAAIFIGFLLMYLSGYADKLR